jgi:cytochrome c oxidase subunit 2
MALPLTLAGCDGAQSALNSGGREAEEIGRLFLVMLGAGAVIWLVVMGIAVWAVLRPPGESAERSATRLIVWGGVAFPVVTLAALLTYGLGMLNLRTQAAAPLRIHVDGRQWWWNVRYETPAGEFVTANEIHLPAGTPAEFRLTAQKVIHSFWIPPLGGKMDMIPGRENRLVLTPDRPGEYRGVCAEFGGASHALMAFSVTVHAPEDFEAWLSARLEPAEPELSEEATRGRELFLAVGCGACHMVRGVVEKGSVGPDLTHVGARRTLGAGIADMDAATLAAWIADPAAFKTGVEMPAYGMLPEREIRSIAEFLSELD